MKKKRVLSLLMVLALLLGTAQPALAADTAATMQISAAEGTVTVTNASGRELTLREDMRLYSGYQVETSAKSYAWINLDDTKLMKLDASSKAEVRKSGKKLEVLLQSGNLYGDVSKPLERDETLDIRTSTAIVGIRGTKFSVGQAGPGRQVPQGLEPAESLVTQVQVYEGTVTVRAKQGPAAAPDASEAAPAMVTTTITAGTQLTVNSGASGETGVFTERPLTAGDISGSTAMELAKTPETLEALNMAISQTAAQALLERDQAAAERYQEEAVRTGLEVEAEPSAVWRAGRPASDSGSSSGSDPATQPFYHVTIHPNGGYWGGNANPYSVTTAPGGRLDRASVPNPPFHSAAVFIGWNTAANGSGAAIDPDGYTFTADTTLYAQWAAPVRFVTFDANGGTLTGGGGRLETDSTGRLVGSIPTAERSGYVFAGWYTATAGGTAIDPDGYTFTANTTLYAQWALPPVYLVTFDANGGTLPGDSTAVTSREGRLSALPAPTRNANTGATAAYTFAGWYTAAEGGTGVTTATEFSSDTTIYAHWVLESGWDWGYTDEAQRALRISGSGDMPDFNSSNPPWSANADAISSLTIESGITSVGMGAFAECGNLTGAALPQSITRIGSYAFQDCTNLANVAISGTPAFESLGLGMYAFLNCEALTGFTVPNGVTELQQYTFSGCTGLNTVTIPASMTAVSAEAFEGCTGLTGITFDGTKDQWDALAYKPPAGVTVTCSDGILRVSEVTFDLNGGAGAEVPSAQQVDYHQTAAKPADPTGDQLFDGWYADALAAAAFDFSAPITADTTVYVKWVDYRMVEGTLYAGKSAMEADYALTEAGNSSAPWGSVMGTIAAAVISEGTARIGGNTLHNGSKLTAI